MTGWGKAQETLGGKCLLIAEHTLEGLLAMPPKRHVPATQLNTAEQGLIGGDGTTEDPLVPDLSFLSCATVSAEGRTLTELFAVAGRMRGEFRPCGCVIE